MVGHPTLHYLYELAEDDKGFVIEILTLMASNIPTDLQSIEDAISNGSCDQMRRSAHHMKSSIQYSNDLDLSELLSVIEKKPDGGVAIKEVQAILPQLKKLANNLLFIITEEKKKLA